MQASVENYFKTARERYRILLARRSGQPAPWTKDPVFSQYRFCNTHREDDKTTMWFRRAVRNRHRDDPVKTLLNTIVFRWFNRIETAEKLMSVGLFDEWDAQRAREALQYCKPVVTGAYVIKTPDGMSKLDGVLWCIENIRPSLPLIAESWMHKPGVSLQVACGTLMNYPYLGGFMAHQLVADLKYTALLRDAPDRLTWAFPGPGTTRGISRLQYDNPDVMSRSNRSHVNFMMQTIRTMVEFSRDPQYWPREWRQWEASDVSNWFCEFDKYLRVSNDGQRMKQRYNPGR